MRIGLVVSLAAALVFVAATAFAGANRSPILASVTARDGHAVVSARFAPGQTPYDVEVSTSPRLTEAGFASGLRLRERLPAAGNGVVRYRTRDRLESGRYWVAVSAQDVDGVVSCAPLRRRVPCLLEWSNVVPLHVR